MGHYQIVRGLDGEYTKLIPVVDQPQVFHNHSIITQFFTSVMWEIMTSPTLKKNKPIIIRSASIFGGRYIHKCCLGMHNDLFNRNTDVTCFCCELSSKDDIEIWCLFCKVLKHHR
jgi:hypothetical protein